VLTSVPLPPQAEAATLAGLSVDFGQGYLLGRPEPVEAFSVHRPAAGEA
jgi:EAL domain-containing protein (putative c-di-GMP-specific phosphodiesterase class I)